MWRKVFEDLVDAQFAREHVRVNAEIRTTRFSLDSGVEHLVQALYWSVHVV